MQELLERLRKAFGPKRILTDPTDLYVYSFRGEFGIMHRGTPVAVVRLLQVEENRSLTEMMKSSNLRLAINTDDAIKDEPFVLLDVREPCDPLTLVKKLKSLKQLDKTGKARLKGATSLPDWLLSFLKRHRGYRLSEEPEIENGFCTVARFFDGLETYSSKGRLLITRGLLKDELEPSERVVDSLYTCTACGQCYDQISTMGLEVNNAIVRARHEVVKRGVNLPASRRLVENIRGEGNPMGMPAEDRALWFEELIDRHSFEGNEVLYWTGCSTSYRLPEVVEATSKVLDVAGVDYGLLGASEGCCGLILYLLGLWDQARENAVRTVEDMKARAVRTMVTSCAGCYYAFSRIYDVLKVPVSFQLLHTSQLMESLIQEGRLKLKGLRGDFVWHDPCDLGRHCGVYEPPREVLGAVPGLKLVEPALNREHALCCGAGGGLMAYDLELTEKISHEKMMEEILPMGVDGIVTGCPACILSLRFAVKALDNSLPVYDLSELVSRCL